MERTTKKYMYVNVYLKPNPLNKKTKDYPSIKIISNKIYPFEKYQSKEKAMVRLDKWNNIVRKIRKQGTIATFSKLSDKKLKPKFHHGYYE